MRLALSARLIPSSLPWAWQRRHSLPQIISPTLHLGQLHHFLNLFSVKTKRYNNVKDKIQLENKPNYFNLIIIRFHTRNEYYQ